MWPDDGEILARFHLTPNHEGLLWEDDVANALREALASRETAGDTPLRAPKVWKQPPGVDGEAVPCHLCGKTVFVKRDGTYRERVAPAVDGDVHDCRSPVGDQETPR